MRVIGEAVRGKRVRVVLALFFIGQAGMNDSVPLLDEADFHASCAAASPRGAQAQSNSHRGEAGSDDSQLPKGSSLSATPLDAFHDLDRSGPMASPLKWCAVDLVALESESALFSVADAHNYSRWPAHCRQVQLAARCAFFLQAVDSPITARPPARRESCE